MHKNTSISLYLAKVMGLDGAHLHTYPVVFEGTAKQDVFISEDIGKKRFDPFTNRAQWADVVLFAASRMCVDFYRGCLMVYPEEKQPLEYLHSNTDESRMAATLEAIALATGWKE